MSEIVKTSPNLTELIKQIKTVFANVPYPQKIIQYGDITDGRYQEDTLKFSGKLWHELADEFIIENYDSLPLFTPEAFRYFLPAYLIVALSYQRGLLPEWIVYELCLPTNDEGKIYFYEKIAGFTKPECQIITEVLVLFQDIYGDQLQPELGSALQFWMQYCDELK